MSDLRKAAEAVLEAWGWDWSEPRNEALRERMEALRQALEQPDEVLAEREACLKEIAIELDEWGWGNNANIALNNVAANIRARSEK